MTVEQHAAEERSGVVDVPSTQARHRMPELIALVQDGTFVYLTQRGRRVAALMPADVAEHYEQIEEEHWARRAEEARERMAAHPEAAVPWDQVIAELEGRGGQ
jgi:prevent-host-death family protein